jgi:hypothetical protein
MCASAVGWFVKEQFRQSVQSLKPVRLIIMVRSLLKHSSNTQQHYTAAEPGFEHNWRSYDHILGQHIGAKVHDT